MMLAILRNGDVVQVVDEKNFHYGRILIVHKVEDGYCYCYSMSDESYVFFKISALLYIGQSHITKQYYNTRR